MKRLKIFALSFLGGGVFVFDLPMVYFLVPSSALFMGYVPLRNDLK